MTMQKKNPETNPIAVLASQSPFMVGMDASDLVFPVYRVAQGQSQAVQNGEVKLGMIYSPQTGTQRAQVRAVILLMNKTRTLWGQELGSAPVCGSEDGMVARPGGQYEGRICAQCPLADGRCRTGYRVLGFDLDEKTPFMFRFNGVSAGAFRDYATYVKNKLGGEPFRVETTLSGEKQSNTKGTYFVVRTRAAQTSLPDKDVLSWRKVAEHLIKQGLEVKTKGDGEDEPASTSKAPAMKTAKEGEDDLF